MFSLKLVNFGLLLFYVILYSTAFSTPKKITDQLDKLLKYPGWRNLNDISSIKYNRKTYYLYSLIEIPTSVHKGESKIRALTVFLGCKYAKVMHIIFSTIIKWEEIYKNQSKEDNDLISECNYTKELINILDILIVPIATLMNGALKTLDSLHHLPWTNFKLYTKKHFIMSSLLEKIEDILDKLNDPSRTREDSSTNSPNIEFLYTFSERIIVDVKKEIHTFCEFVSYNTNDLWNECIQEYIAFNNPGVKLISYEFLIKKIKDYIRTVIIENYFDLGFKYDPITEETFIQKPQEFIESELEFKATDEEPPTPVQIEIH
ncbi:uncharacterized protein LOC126907396 isoform X1 [Daktulosphaira vitifoliae]|uniref:uncharacterized protein LOC126907396 isoform X1 n=1 Tax=Daktulosphaira vitifoliae TaxID=58002 RepID=UPI0021AA1177|nr:uncharacterized protein LOC126907396 isoform X1 [Daktulosphaira vitifoliae]